MRDIAIALIIGLTLSGCSRMPANHAESRDIEAIPDGTYKIAICSGDCSSDKKAIHGIMVFDETRKTFSGQSEAMQYLMRADIQTTVPNYCYYFDPETSNGKDTLFEYDIVSFGEQIDETGSDPTLYFLIDSPDFRYISRVRASGDNRLIGDWSSSYAGDGGVQRAFPGTRLHAEKISGPDGSICFDAVRKHEREALKGYCEGFAARTCEPGDQPTVQTPADES